MKHIIPLILTLALLGCQTSPADITLPAPTASHIPAPTAAPPSAEQALRADVIAQIQTDLHYQSPYVQALEAVSGMSIPETCADFAVKLSAFEENLTAQQFRASAAGICYVTTADGAVSVDAWNNDGPLYLTPAIASQALGVQVARVSADGRYGSIGDAYDAQGRRVGGVSKFLLQWEAVNANGVLPSEADPSSAPSTPVNPGQSNLYQVNYAPAIDAEAQAIQALVGDYMSGKLKEISSMNFEQRKAFSIALAEEKNKQRGVNPVIYNGEAYIHPETFDMVSVNDGSSAKEQTILMNYPAVRDNEGYLQIYVNGEWRKINNSKDVKFTVSNNPADIDPNFNPPTTEKLGADRGELAGLTVPEAALAKTERPAVMMPIVVLDLQDDPGEIFIHGYGRKQGTLPVVAVETDANDNAVSARLVIVSGVGRLYKEGSSATAGGSSGFNAKTALWMELKGNTLFYLFAYDDQARNFEETYVQGSGEVTKGYSGVVPSNLSFAVVSGKKEDKRVVWLDAFFMIEADNH